MKNKLVITELNRIHELMGKPLIMESWLSIADEVLEIISRRLPAQSNKIQELITKLGNSTSEAEIRGIITKLINSSDEIAEILIPKILSTLTDLERRTISDFKKYLANEIKSQRVQPHDAARFVERFVNEKLTTNMKPIQNYLKKDIENAVNKAIIDSKTLSYPEAFFQGYRTNTGGGLFAKKVVLRNLPIPYVGKYFRANIYRLTNTERKIVKKWFWTGIGDYNQIVQIFRKYGIGPAIANLSGQLFKKWVFWTGVLTVGNILIDKIPGLFGEQIHKSQLEAFSETLKEHFQTADIVHVTPWVAIINYVVGPFLQEGAFKEPTDKLVKHIKNFTNKSENEVNKIENSVNTVKQKVNKIISKIDNTEDGFKNWCENQNPKKEFAGYNVDNDGLGRTIENGVITTWRWDKQKQIFVEY
jgi:hypothetical protein